MRVDLFDFHLPQDRIAVRPVRPGHDARLLCVNSQNNTFDDNQVKDLSHLMKEGDLLVFNNTKVIPARLVGRRISREGSRPKIEVNLHKKKDHVSWLAFVRPAKKLEQGDILSFGEQDQLIAHVAHKGDAGEVELKFETADLDLEALLHEVGEMPLPPYIAAKRKPDQKDLEDYQTLFAKQSGAVAAPTAGLHFTDELMGQLSENKIDCEFITLHVGAGTFLPVKSDNTDDHKMHSEWGEISKETADKINQVHKQGGKVIAVGTTSLRLLESAADEEGIVHPFSGDTDIFITPGYKFRAVDMLFTNFHLPKSTLFMLVSAFSGLDCMQAAYKYAIENEYRFYSYGDACLLNCVSRIK